MRKKPRQRRAASRADPIPDDIGALAEADAGAGISPHLIDRTLTLEQGDMWMESFVELEDGNAAPLFALLKGGEPMPPAIRFWFAHIIDKYELKLRHGKGKLNAPYVVPWTEHRRREINDLVSDLKREVGSVKTAQEKAAKKTGRDFDTIARYRRGSHTSARRWKARTKGR